LADPNPAAVIAVLVTLAIGDQFTPATIRLERFEGLEPAVGRCGGGGDKE